MSTRTAFIVATTLMLNAVACGGTTPPAADASAANGAEIDAESAKARASAAVAGGVVGDAKKIDDKDEHRWAVEVKLPGGGAVVVVEVERKDGSVAEIKGEEGPFDYDFSPGEGFLKLADARARALAAKAGEIQEWEIDLDDSEYEFEIKADDGKIYEVELDAKSGSVKKVEEKKPGE